MFDAGRYLAAWTATRKAALLDALAEHEMGQGVGEDGLLLALAAGAAVAALVLLLALVSAAVAAPVLLGPRIVPVVTGVGASLTSVPTPGMVPTP